MYYLPVFYEININKFKKILNKIDFAVEINKSGNHYL